MGFLNNTTITVDAILTKKGRGAGSGIGATTPFFLGEDDAPNSKTLVAQSVKLTPVPVTNNSSTQITVIGNDTGATSSITVTNRVTLASLAAL